MNDYKDEKIWENKAIREARESSHKNAATILEIAERLGLLAHVKTLDELFTEFNGIRNRLFDHIYEDIPLHADELFNKKESEKGLYDNSDVHTGLPAEPMYIKKSDTIVPDDATIPQRKRIWGMVYGDNGNIELEQWLKPMGIDRFNLTKPEKMFINRKWASDFIEKNTMK